MDGSKPLIFSTSCCRASMTFLLGSPRKKDRRFDITAWRISTDSNWFKATQVWRKKREKARSLQPLFDTTTPPRTFRENQFGVPSLPAYRYSDNANPHPAT